jgi:hypothetical protein
LCTAQQPSPDSYRLKSEFDPDAPPGVISKIAFSFGGATRKAYDKVFNPNQTVNPDARVPGPGHYAFLNHTIGTEGKRFSLKSRVTVPEGKQQIDIYIFRRN